MSIGPFLYREDVMKLRLISVCMGILLSSLAIVFSQEEYTQGAYQVGSTPNIAPWVAHECGNPRGSSDVKRLAKRAWSRPYGPNKAEYRNFFTAKRCARTYYQYQARFRSIWKSYKEKLISTRSLAKSERECDQSPTDAVIACIEYSSQYYNYPLSTLYRIASCESEFDPHAENPLSDASGLFQYLDNTWSDTVARMIDAGEPIKNNVYSAKWASLATAWKMSNDGTGEWVCQ